MNDLQSYGLSDCWHFNFLVNCLILRWLSIPYLLRVHDAAFLGIQLLIWTKQCMSNLLTKRKLTNWEPNCNHRFRSTIDKLIWILFNRTKPDISFHYLKMRLVQSSLSWPTFSCVMDTLYSHDMTVPLVSLATRWEIQEAATAWWWIIPKPMTMLSYV